MSDQHIYLDESAAARPFPIESQVFLPQIVRILDQVHALWRRNERRDREPDSDGRKRRDCGSETPQEWRRARTLDRKVKEDRVHQSFGIFAPRGAGKTSALLTVMRLLEESEDGAKARKTFADEAGRRGYGNADALVEIWRTLSSGIESIGVVEPALMERGEHVVEAVFTAMLRDADSQLRGPLRDTPRLESRAAEMRRAASEVIQRLPVIIHPRRLTDATRRYGLQGLTDEILKFGSGDTLERAIWGFAQAYLDLVGKKMVLVPIDDVDMAFEHGKQVLESLRRYLTAPNMLMMVTGDPALFSWTLRASFAGKLDPKGALPADGGRRGSRPRMLGDLGDHYLKKVLPSRWRVSLPDITTLDLDNVRIHESRDDKEGRLVARHLHDVISSWTNMGSRLGTDAESVTYDAFRFLIPGDMRHFIELCGIDTGAGRRRPDTDTGSPLFELARVWRAALERFDLDPRLLVALVNERRVGLGVLNHLLRREELPDTALRLDPRTDDPDLNVTLALLQFAITANLGRNSLLLGLSVGLDLIVPVHYISHSGGSEARRRMRAEVELWLMDSQRRLYQRLVPWIARRGRVQPGIVTLCDQAGHLEKLLDVHDGSLSAEWWQILGDPERRNDLGTERATKETCDVYLRQGAAKDANDDAPWPQISGYRWATRYLPQAFGAAYIPDEHKKMVLTVVSVDPRKQVTVPRPLPSEQVTSPELFHLLAGALPRVILQCWTIEEGGRSHLSPWQAISLVERIIRRTGADPRLSASTRERQPDILLEIVGGCLREHLDRPGVARRGADRDSTSRSGDASDYVSAVDLPRQWPRLAAANRIANTPERLYPEFRRLGADEEGYAFAWPFPPDARTSKHGAGESTEVADTDWTPIGDWFESSPDPKAAFNPKDLPWHDGKGLHPIQSYHDLQAARNRARDDVVARLALALAEWLWVWPRVYLGSMDPRGASRATFDTVRQIFTSFFEDLGDEVEFTSTWPGAGDIIQRWVLSFLNAVLVETLQPPSLAESGGHVVPRPGLDHGRRATVPGRAAPFGEGARHPLYENLTALQHRAAPYSDGQDWKNHHWHWSDAFSALASCPLFAMFLPGGGPIPTIEPEASRPSDWTSREMLRKAGGGSELGRIVRLGGLMLLPLPSLDRAREWLEAENARVASPGELQQESSLRSIWPGLGGRQMPMLLDLSGLSWCGFDLCESKTPESETAEAETAEAATAEAKDPVFGPINQIERRRRALIAMLNSVVADFELAPEAERYRIDLALAVWRALHPAEHRK